MKISWEMFASVGFQGIYILGREWGEVGDKIREVGLVQVGVKQECQGEECDLYFGGSGEPLSVISSRTVMWTEMHFGQGEL